MAEQYSPADTLVVGARVAQFGVAGQIDDAAAIAAALLAFVARAEAGQAPLATEAVRRSHARSARTVQLAALFDAVVAETRQAAKSSKAP